MPEAEKKKRFTLTKTQTIITLICGVFVIVAGLYSFGSLCIDKFTCYDKTVVHTVEFKAFQFQVNEQTLQNRIDFYQRLVWDLEVLHDTTDPLKMGHDIEKYRTALKNLDMATKQLEAMKEIAAKEGKDNP